MSSPEPRREEHIQECMAEGGFDYEMRDPSDQVVMDGDQPGWGTAHGLLQTIRAMSMESGEAGQQREEQGDDPAAQDALIACADGGFAAQQEAREALASSYSALERGWEEFRASAGYVEASRD